MTVGERIKLKREELGWSQTELAKKMGYSGKASVSKAETWDDNITTAKVDKFAKALGCSFEYLMGWEEPTKEEMLSKETAILLAQITKNYELQDYVRKLAALSDANRKTVYTIIDALSNPNQSIPALEPSQNQE